MRDNGETINVPEASEGTGIGVISLSLDLLQADL